MGLGVHLPHLNILLPIGLSFHTLQSMSYTIEVPAPNARNGIWAYAPTCCSIRRWPAVERPQNLLTQLHTPVEQPA